jgi:putative transposase
MPRTKRADEAGALYHALNRGNARATIFHKDGDYEAFERILAEGLQRYDVQLFAYQLIKQ